MAGERILVAGPPCAGKTTYVQEHADPDDLVLDSDTMRQALSSSPRYRWVQAHEDYVWAAFYAVVNQHQVTAALSRPRLWVIQTAPRARQRARYQANGAAVVVLETPSAECLRRLKAAPEGRPVPAWSLAITEWWNAYERSVGDLVLSPVDG